jgi:nicotinic acid phosphoribosyltransferase
MEPLPGALLTDLYHLTMIEAYLESGQTDTAVEADDVINTLPLVRLKKLLKR